MRRTLFVTGLALVGVLAGSVGASAQLTTEPQGTVCRVQDARHHFASAAHTLQAAVDAASPGDTLAVQGICHGDTVVNKNLAIQGTRFVVNANFSTPHGGVPVIQVLDGDDASGSVVTVLPGVTVALRYLIIENGTGGDGATGSFGGGFTVGGGIDNAGALTLQGVLITNNTASSGRGIYNEGGSLTSRSRSIVTANTATGPGSGGGGIFIAGGTVNLGEMAIFGNTPDDVAP
jgi:hypothetical protein